MIKIEVCPGTLAPGFDRYSPLCIRQVFDGKQVSPILDFQYDADQEDFISAVNRISISGVQEKLSAIVSGKKIQLTREGEHGRYIIKPAPDYKHLRYREQIPANEHLTMQIARQVYKIKTANNALVFFLNGKQAYLTNNGPLAHRVLSPRHHVPKVYRFSAAEPMADGVEELFRDGVTLADGYECKSAIIELDEDRMGGFITLTEGKYHQIKRMVASTHNRVVTLERISFGEIELDRTLARGEYRLLSAEEIATLEKQN